MRIVEKNNSYIYICYARKDKEKVYPILKGLQENGVLIWYDNGELKDQLGEKWEEAIDNAIKNCGGFFTFVSKNSVKSEQCKREIFVAIDNNIKNVSLIYLDDAQLSKGINLLTKDTQNLERSNYKDKDLVPLLTEFARRFGYIEEYDELFFKAFDYITKKDGVKITNLKNALGLPRLSWTEDVAKEFVKAGIIKAPEYTQEEQPGTSDFDNQGLKFSGGLEYEETDIRESDSEEYYCKPTEDLPNRIDPSQYHIGDELRKKSNKCCAKLLNCDYVVQQQNWNKYLFEKFEKNKFTFPKEYFETYNKYLLKIRPWEKQDDPIAAIPQSAFLTRTQYNQDELCFDIRNKIYGEGIIYNIDIKTGTFSALLEGINGNERNIKKSYLKESIESNRYILNYYTPSGYSNFLFCYNILSELGIEEFDKLSYKDWNQQKTKLFFEKLPDFLILKLLVANSRCSGEKVYTIINKGTPNEQEYESRLTPEELNILNNISYYMYNEIERCCYKFNKAIDGYEKANKRFSVPWEDNFYAELFIDHAEFALAKLEEKTGISYDDLPFCLNCFSKADEENKRAIWVKQRLLEGGVLIKENTDDQPLPVDESGAPKFEELKTSDDLPF